MAPSKAATELAKDIETYLGLQNCTKPIQLMIAKRIDLSVADLLEKADEVAKRYHTQSDLDELAAALEPWKAGE